MPGKNQGRLAQDMKREVIAVIGQMKDPRLAGGLLTVTRLAVTQDLDVARVSVSVLGGDAAAAVAALNRASGYVRTEISRRMHIRKAPRFVFCEDDGAAYAAHINQLIADLQPGETPEAAPERSEQQETAQDPETAGDQTPEA